MAFKSWGVTSAGRDVSECAAWLHHMHCNAYLLLTAYVMLIIQILSCLRFFYVHIRRNLSVLSSLVALVKGMEALLLNPFLNLETCMHQVSTKSN